MPIYEYECANCHKVFEHLMFGSRDESHLKCPECGHEQVSRVMSLTGIMGTLSGSGCATKPGSGFS